MNPEYFDEAFHLIELLVLIIVLWKADGYLSKPKVNQFLVVAGKIASGTKTKWDDMAVWVGSFLNGLRPDRPAVEPPA